MGKTMVFSNRKGGVGKTTTAEQTADICSNKTYGFGLKTLCIDLDPQGSWSNSYHMQGKPGVYDLIINNIDTRIKVNESLDFLTSHDLGKLAAELAGQPFAEVQLSDAISNFVDDYDLIIIDCPPEDDWLNNCAYAAADKIIIPVTADRYSVEGVVELSKRVNMIKRLNQDISFGGILLTKVNKRTNAYKEALIDSQECANILNTKVFVSSISLSTVADDAQKAYKTIYEFAPKSVVASEYLEFVFELIIDNFSESLPKLPEFTKPILIKMMREAMNFEHKSDFENSLGHDNDERFDWITLHASDDTLAQLFHTDYLTILHHLLDCTWFLTHMS